MIKGIIQTIILILEVSLPLYSFAQPAATAPAGQQQLTAEQQAQQAKQRTVERGDMSTQAFAGVVSKQLPLTPEQIAELRKAFESSRRAAATPAGIPPRPTTSSVLVNLSPSAAPPVVRLGPGYISSLVFVDSTGQPWPIKAYSVGDPNSFNIQWNKKSNTLLIQADAFFQTQ